MAEGAKVTTNIPIIRQRKIYCGVHLCK